MGGARGGDESIVAPFRGKTTEDGHFNIAVDKALDEKSRLYSRDICPGVVCRVHMLRGTMKPFLTNEMEYKLILYEFNYKLRVSQIIPTIEHSSIRYNNNLNQLLNSIECSI
jgi:hypothetical protein